MEESAKLNTMGTLYLKALRTAGLDVQEEKPGVYRVSGTSDSGREIEGYLDSSDFNDYSKRLQHVLGLTAEKPEGSLGHQEHRVLSPEELDAHRNKREKEMYTLLDLVMEPDEEPETQDDSE